MLSCLPSNLTSVGSSLGFGTERVSNIKQTRNREREEAILTSMSAALM